MTIKTWPISVTAKSYLGLLVTLQPFLPPPLLGVDIFPSGYPIVPGLLLKTFLSPLNCLCTLWKVSCPYMCGSVSLNLSVCQYHTILVTEAL